MFRRAAIAGATLAILGGATVFASPAAATKPCPIEYCTDSSGEYVLTVPALTGKPILGVYADCIWDAHVAFGDGTEQDYVFDASVGLTGSHVFPARGRTYVVLVHLSNGSHHPSGEPCPEYDQTAEVRYRTAAEEADDPATEPPATPTDPPKQEGGAGTGPVGVPVAPVSHAAEESGVTPISSASDPYWQRCRGAVMTHLVSCRRGRQVAVAASARLTRPGTARVSGFSCRLPAGGIQPIVCARHAQRVLAPV